MSNRSHEPNNQAEPYFAAMEFLMQYQNTADDDFIDGVTRQIRLLWEGAKLERARMDNQRRAPPLTLVGS